MVNVDSEDEACFGEFRLKLRDRLLSHKGRPVKLGTRALDILCVLASAGGDVVTKDELLARVWPGSVVEESNIQVHVSALRKALEQGAEGKSLVVTVAGRGYRLIGLGSPPSKIAPLSAEQRPLPRTSIAVLPFANMSGDPEQEYFADGIVEDIITGLSRIKWLLVIARNSSFIYKGKAVDLRRIGEELGCRYLVEGSVRRAGNRIRLTAQLIEAQTGAHVWAERYDRLLEDIFAVQDEITTSLIGAIEPSLRKLEIERVKRKRPDSLDSYDLVLRALPSVHNFMTAGADAAIPFLQQALELEPDYAGAHALLARCFHYRYSRGGLLEEDRKKSIYHARAAIQATDDATTLAIAAIVIWFDERDVTTALKLFEQALAISASNVVALANSAFVLAWMGESERALDRAQRALKVSPFDTLNAFLAIAIASFSATRYEEAREAARRAIEANPQFSVPYILLAVSLAQLGQLSEAKAAAKRVIALDPTFTMDRWSRTVGHVPAVFDTFAKTWQKLGLSGEKP